MHTKIISHIIWGSLSALACHAAAQTSEGESTIGLVKNLYSFSLATFEFAEFDGRLNLKKHCELLKQYFSEDLVKQPTTNSGCVISNLISIRYPSLRMEDLGTARASFHLPKPEFSMLVANTEEAAVDVIAGRAKSIYFLRAVDREWRIVNALVFEKWPLVDGPCLSSFLAQPSKEQKKIEAKECRSQKVKS
ncbi:MAG: hypothetical protein HXX19_05925 [Rhodoferax sp.]|nr:hypothetical protein [Rhodoferax sp.]